MLRKVTTALIALLVFGFPSVVSAQFNKRADNHSLFVQSRVSLMFNDRSGAVNDAARTFTTEDKRSFAALPRVPSVLFCRDESAGGTKPWIKLTAPSGDPVHINVGQITSVRSDTEIPGAKAQLDLASGKFQRVQENVERVMQLISPTLDARETPSAALTCVGSTSRPLRNVEDQSPGT